jgi:TP901 family phage tail tape measure protein
MADMKVRLLLDLVNRLSPQAKTAQKDLRAVGAAAKDLGKVRAGDKLSRDLDRTRASAARTAREIRNMKAAMADFARTAAIAAQSAGAVSVSARGGRGGAAVAGAAAVGRRTLVGAGVGLGGYGALRGTIGQSVSYEKAMAAVRNKLDGMDDPKAFQEVSRMVSAAAIEYGKAREEVAALVAEGGASGISREQMPEFIKLVLSASTAWDQTADKAANAMAKIKAQTGASMGELRDFGDLVNALSDAGSAKEMDVVEMFKRAGAAAKASGVDMKTALAALTAMNNVGMEPEVAARGFGAMIGNLAQATEQGKDFQVGLKMLGLSAKKLEKDMKVDAAKALIDVFQRLEKHADKGKAAIKLFGKEWWDEALRTGQAMPEMMKNLKIVNDPKAWKGSMDKSLNIQLATTANHLERLKSLTSAVGDRLGKWALPPINDAIQRIIDGFNELDRRSGKAKADDAAVSSAAETLAAGKELSPEQRKRMATDADFNSAVSVAARTRKNGDADRKAADLKTALNRDRSEDGMDVVQGQRRREIERLRLDREIDDLAASLKRRDPAGRDATFTGERRRLDGLRAKRGHLGPSEAPSTGTTFGRSDADEMRARLPHSMEASKKAEIEQLRRRIDAIERLADSQQNPKDRSNFLKDASGDQRRLMRSIAPNSEAANWFGFAAGGSKAAAPASIGYGAKFGFGAGGAAADQLKQAMEIDLGPAGMTLGEKLAGGLKSSQGQTDGAAQQIGEGIKGKLSSVEAGSAGQKIMADFAAGITSGGAAAVAAAEGVAARVKAAMGAGGGARSASLASVSSAALHDGVA